MSNKVKLSSKGQIVIPKGIRGSLELKPGTELRVKVAEGRLILEPLKSFTDTLCGLGKEIWEDVDARKYINKERESWKE